jgi:hypothetical protein
MRIRIQESQLNAYQDSQYCFVYGLKGRIASLGLVRLEDSEPDPVRFKMEDSGPVQFWLEKLDPYKNMYFKYCFYEYLGFKNKNQILTE